MTPESLEELCARLEARDPLRTYQSGFVATLPRNPDGVEAATALRAKAARIAELERERDGWQREASSWTETYLRHKERADRATELLREAHEHVNCGMCYARIDAFLKEQG